MSRRALSTMGMFSWYKILIFRKINISVLKIFPIKFFSENVCISRTARRVFSSCHLFHWHVLLIHCSNYQPDRSAASPDIHNQFFFETGIRRTARRGVPSCCLFHVHVLLIQCSPFQSGRFAVSPDIRTQFFFESRLYLENRSTGGPVVPPLTWACSFHTRF